MAIENRIGKVKSNKKGYLMDFNKEKIALAILKASKEVGGLSNNIDPDSIYTRFRGEEDEIIAQALTEDVILCLNMQREHRAPHHPPTLEEIHDIVIDVLKDRGFMSVSSVYSIYREGKRAIRMGWLSKNDFVGGGYPKKEIQKRENFLKKLGIENIKDLNKKIKEGKFLELVKQDTKRYEKELRDAVNKFEKLKKERNLKVMIIAGPSSSGKTTTSRKLCKYLEKKGYKFKLLEVDNYFFSASEYPRDWFGDMDYELPESIDLKRLNEDLEKLMKGKKIYPPYYDFKTGSRLISKTSFKLEKDEVLLLDCLHGLYPPATDAIPNDMKFKVYIENHTAIKDINNKKIKFTDIRMLRRMCRDVRERGYSVKYTLEHWATVRKGEFKGIIPFYKTADVIINGSLIYDLPVLKYYLYNYCDFQFDDEILNNYKERGRMDAYRRGKRVKELLNTIELPSKEEIEQIPEDNLIREFIGKKKG